MKSGLLGLILVVPLATSSLPVWGQEQTKAIDYPFYQTKDMLIVADSHAPMQGWCRQSRERRFGSGDRQPYRFIVRYTAPHDQRDALFAPNFESFVSQTLVPNLKRACADSAPIPGNFLVHMAMTNSKDPSGYYDLIRDGFTFRFRDGEVIRTAYDPGHELTKGKSFDEIVAMKLPPVLRRKNTVIDTVGPFTIYPHDYELCTKTGVEVDITFDMPGAQRDDWLVRHYGRTKHQGIDRFYEQHLLPKLRELCGNRFSAVRALFYERDATEIWDQLMFKVLPPGYVQSKISPVEVVTTHSLGTAAQKLADEQRIIAQNALFGPCDGKPFCDLPGGAYLDAIFQNDEARILEIDQEMMRNFLDSDGMRVIEDFAKIFSGTYGDDQRHDMFGLDKSSLLQHVAVKYMALYGKIYGHDSTQGACLGGDARRIAKKDRTKIVKFENMHGVDQGSVGGIEFGEIYTINKELVPLCNSICSATGDDGANFFAAGLGSPKAQLIMNGVSHLLTELDCNSAEVKQFEENLVTLTLRSLRR